MARIDAAQVVQLSPTTTAFIYGSGKVMLERGGRTMYLNDREARILSEAHVAYEAARRPR